MAKKEKGPVHRIPLGNICAAIWENENGKGGVWYNVTITRSYRDGESWNDSTSYSRDDLPVVAVAAQMAHFWIWERISASRKEQAAEE